MNFAVRVITKELLCIGVAFLAGARCNGSATNDPPQNVAVPPAQSAEARLPVPVTTLKTLRPQFEWTAPNEAGVVYDLVICEGMAESHGYWIPGKTIHHREGITTTKYALEQPLSPDTIYVWSVRARSGNRVSKWTEYLDGDWSRLQTGPRRHNILWPFKTPGI
jgi:hypothetical protein